MSITVHIKTSAYLIFCWHWLVISKFEPGTRANKERGQVAPVFPSLRLRQRQWVGCCVVDSSQGVVDRRHHVRSFCPVPREPRIRTAIVLPGGGLNNTAYWLAKTSPCKSQGSVRHGRPAGRGLRVRCMEEPTLYTCVVHLGCTMKHTT